ncbi:hypothetical protein EV356DRAFT_506984 [Viridothelium virens]|uniref:Uncharacterized protein n=1 Tax=Viridothelium virens TaxID=1048519 RepID=A0A6A6H0M4_VIRVR|nr:hypothetical protein EV356DRAFT_506984 [Viridothelium virens]
MLICFRTFPKVTPGSHDSLSLIDRPDESSGDNSALISLKTTLSAFSHVETRASRQP